MSRDEKKKASTKPKTLAQLRKAILARHNPTIHFEGEAAPAAIPTRFARLNAVLGGGLFPGSVVEIFGPNDAGKTALALALAADVQKAAPKRKRHVFLSHFEQRQTDAIWKWRRTLGLDTDDLAFTEDRPRTLEVGLSNAVKHIRTGELSAWVVDSVFAGGSKDGAAVVEGWGDSKPKNKSVGLEARIWGEAWTAIVPLLAETGTIAIAINQERVVINMGGWKSSYGPEVSSPRGAALKFYAWQRLYLSARGLDPKRWGDAGADGRSVQVKVIKNGASDAARGKCRYDLIRGVGWDLEGDMLDLALEAGAITGNGKGRFSIQGKLVASSFDRLREFVGKSEKVRAWLAASVSSYLSRSPGAATPDADGGSGASNEGEDAEGSGEDAEGSGE